MKKEITPFSIINSNVKNIKKELLAAHALAYQDINLLARSTHNFFMNLCVSYYEGNEIPSDIFFKHMEIISKEMFDNGYKESARKFIKMWSSALFFHTTATKEYARRKGGAK